MRFDDFLSLLRCVLDQILTVEAGDKEHPSVNLDVPEQTSELHFIVYEFIYVLGDFVALLLVPLLDCNGLLAAVGLVSVSLRQGKAFDSSIASVNVRDLLVFGGAVVASEQLVRPPLPILATKRCQYHVCAQHRVIVRPDSPSSWRTQVA